MHTSNHLGRYKASRSFSALTIALTELCGDDFIQTKFLFRKIITKSRKIRELWAICANWGGGVGLFSSKRDGGGTV